MASQMKPSIYDVYLTEYQFEDYDISPVSEEKYNAFFEDNEDLKPNETNDDNFDKFIEYFQNIEAVFHKTKYSFKIFMLNKMADTIQTRIICPPIH